MPIFRGKNFVSADSDYKDSVRAATRTNVDLTSLIYSVDDIALSHQDRVLLVGQENPSQNGIYAWNAMTSTLARAKDADSSVEVQAGLKVFVQEGTHNSQTSWTLVTPGHVTVGTTNLTFARENRIGNFEWSGTHGTTSTALTIVLDESGQITSITESDIALDGGEF
ncbi:hypothetical protein UFOVP71_27 [uncultured Caudovirales phage]|uniref:Uncharacterized protein n=1 Tax=uncultured Caudovirales phage TaxID=2100421 RepID=A0A6J5TB62_9CAUD|nr:hypothetical protein UFOVP71_27 [uncultured Caudovirales phage]